jgi:IS30 family transposase
MKYRKRNCNRSRIKDRVSIEARPLIVAEKKRIGDWEGDTILKRHRK